MIIEKTGEVVINMRNETVTLNYCVINCEGAASDYACYTILAHAKRIIQKEMDKYKGIEP